MLELLAAGGPRCLLTGRGGRPRQWSSSYEDPCASQHWCRQTENLSVEPHSRFLLQGPRGTQLTISAQPASPLRAPSCPAGFATPSSPIWRTGSKTNTPGIWACFQHLRACSHQTICTSLGSRMVTAAPRGEQSGSRLQTLRDHVSAGWSSAELGLSARNAGSQPNPQPQGGWECPRATVTHEELRLSGASI